MRNRLERVLQWKQIARKTGAKQLAVAILCGACLTIGALVAPAADEPAPYKIGGDVTAPQIIEKHEPEYTKEAKDAKVQGSVLLSIVITDTGLPKNIHVLKGLDPGLDQEAVEAVSSWRFKPATKKGQPVPVSANVEVNFRLLDDHERNR